MPILRGEEELQLRRDVLKRTPSAKAKRRARLAFVAEDGDLDDPVAQTLFEKLRARRRELAEEQGVPPYVIFHDRALAAMAVHRPVTAEAFLGIGGVGEKKLERYGAVFMELIRESAAG